MSSYTYPGSGRSVRSRSRRGSRASGRPAGPSTRASTCVEDMNEYVVALSQSRGNGTEVGIAVHSLSTGHTVLTQVADTPFFQKTLQHLTLHPPCTVLVPENRNQAGENIPSGTQLIEEVEDSFELECVTLPREYWNREKGHDDILRLAVRNEVQTSTLMAAEEKYYALCAISALFKFLEVRQGLKYPKEALKIRYASSEGTMFIDTDTAKNLELVKNTLTNTTKDTLYGILNKCFTPMGSRLLRGNILQPSNIQHTIEGRLDAVQELLSSPEKLKSIRDGLKALGSTDLDTLILQASRKRQGSVSVVETEARISILLQLQKYIQGTKSIQEEMTLGKCRMLVEIQKEMSDPMLLEIERKIQECLTTDGITNSAKRRNLTTARLYAVKAEFNHLLDVARTTFKENLDDIEHTILTSMTERHSLHCTLEPVENKFRLALKPQDVEGRALPGECINVQRKKTKCVFSSVLLQHNARLEEAQQEILLLSGDIVMKLLASVLDHISGLYRCSDAVSSSDGVYKFRLIYHLVRPMFGETIAIKLSRHPILDKTLGRDDCVPNDIYAAQGHASFQLIQGPNMSGKSTFLRQVGLLTVQAMLGCYVPATYANFRLHDALLSRLSNDDSLDRNLSTFASEMATSAMILGLATPNSLILIDELGRGTAPLEGLGLSHAIAESLINRQSFVFFTTHFHDLATTLGSMRGVVRMHLRVQDNRVEDDNNAFSTTFQYKVEEGPAVIEHYGLKLAKLASLPADVLNRAKEVAMSLSELEAKGRDSTASHAMIKRRKLLLERREADNEELAQTLRHLQRESLDEFTKTFQAVA
ncbi:hypothetical protein I204_04848 [Kwoniella mangroviensis CBS 8886]|nr:uncharacterized protein I203_06262 [Kwoniella mangroviensis CBS 8507]OCF64531.1 hypothetical protein I203_06262 [Kwoniella mangroviensis CBS 8507]OCF74473.1 hypothetical protein I204_04848 [Kwoniella mangroviensis CBS 8886]